MFETEKLSKETVKNTEGLIKEVDWVATKKKRETEIKLLNDQITLYETLYGDYVEKVNNLKSAMGEFKRSFEKLGNKIVDCGQIDGKYINGYYEVCNFARNFDDGISYFDEFMTKCSDEYEDIKKEFEIKRKQINNIIIYKYTHVNVDNNITSSVKEY